MPVFDTTTPGAPVWIDLLSSDPDRSAGFYGELFGWSATAGAEDLGGYVTFGLRGAPVAGMMHNSFDGVEDAWGVYLLTPDAAATAAAAERAGIVLGANAQVADLGTMIVMHDVTGAMIGGWQPDGHKGFGLTREPGAPAWFELHTRDHDAAVAFYRDVFGWTTSTMSDTEEFRFTTLGDGDAAEAGIVDASASLPQGAPSRWVVYVAVADADDALARVAHLGGEVLGRAEDTPVGRMAQVLDPTGAAFTIVQELPQRVV